MQSTEKKGFSGKDAVRRLFSDYSYLVSFVLILIIAVSVNPNFFRWRNISTLFRQSATTTGMIALSMTMIICAGQIDISVGAQVALFGHTHRALCEQDGGVWYLNPGAAKNDCYGVVEVRDGKIHCALKTLSDEK